MYTEWENIINSQNLAITSMFSSDSSEILSQKHAVLFTSSTKYCINIQYHNMQLINEISL